MGARVIPPPSPLLITALTSQPPLPPSKQIQTMTEGVRGGGARESSSSLASRLETWKLAVRGLMNSARRSRGWSAPAPAGAARRVSRGVSPRARRIGRRGRAGAERRDSCQPAPRRRPPPVAAPLQPPRPLRMRPAPAPPVPWPGRARGPDAPRAAPPRPSARAAPPPPRAGGPPAPPGPWSPPPPPRRRARRPPTAGGRYPRPGPSSLGSGHCAVQVPAGAREVAKPAQDRAQPPGLARRPLPPLRLRQIAGRASKVAGGQGDLSPPRGGSG